MNDRTRSTASAALVESPAQSDAALTQVLQSSLYPGARPESIALVLAWCRATGRDPMKKPIHIVPMYVKDARTGKSEYRDTLMPGIGTYRTDAANSGQYAGKTEPEFGPDEETVFAGSVKVKYPKWCKVTVQRIVAGQVRDFAAKEFWLENYASAGRDTDAPNAMWKKRPYGQLAKCAESQALRMAFPDETGNTNTAEEMEGKDFIGTTIDHPPSSPSTRFAAISEDPPVRDPAMVKFVDDTCATFAACKTQEQRSAIMLKIDAHMAILREEAPELAERIVAAGVAPIAGAHDAFSTASQGATKPAPATAAPEPAPPPPTPTTVAPVQGFECWGTDEFGDPDENGEVFTSEVAFSEWFAGRAATCGSILALREHNMDGIADAYRSMEAKAIIEEAIAAAEARQKPTVHDEPAPAEQGPTPVAIPMTPGGKPHWPNYYAACQAQIDALGTPDEVTGWVDLNHPSYADKAAGVKIDKMVDDRLAALRASSQVDHDLVWAENALATIVEIKTRDALANWIAMTITKTKMDFFRGAREELYARVKDALEKRRAELR